MSRWLLATVLVVSVVLLAPAGVAHADYGLFGLPTGDHSMNVGVALDAQGNVYVTSQSTSGELFLTKYTSSGSLENLLYLGSVLFSKPDAGHLVFVNKTLIRLTSTGELDFIDPATLKITSSSQLSKLTVDNTHIFDVYTGGINQSLAGMIDLASSSYGDLTAWITGNNLDLLISGMSQANTFPFVLRLHVDGAAGTSTAKIVVASSAPTVSCVVPQTSCDLKVARGITVTPNGTVFTTLPNIPPGPPSPFPPISDYLYEFSAEFDLGGSSSLIAPTRVLPSLNVVTTGMSSDQNGNIYLTPWLATFSSVGLCAPNSPSGSGLVVIPATLDTARCYQGGVSVAATLGDVAVSPDGLTAYLALYDPLLDQGGVFQWANATITASSTTSSGTQWHVGDTVKISGENFGNDAVSIYIDSTTSPEIASFTSSENSIAGYSLFNGSFTLPSLSVGAHTIIAQGLLFKQKAAFPFSVVSSSAPTSTPVPPTSTPVPPTSTPVPPDTTLPSCTLTGTGADSSGRKYIQITAQDSGSGMQTVTVTQSTNATTSVPTFIAGTTSALVVTATKINQSQSSQVGLRVTDMAGNVTDCDPVMTDLLKGGNTPVTDTFTGILQGEHLVHIYNGNPGLSHLIIRVNGRKMNERDLRPNEQRTVDIAKALHPGNHNTVTIVARGKQRGNATLVIADS